jgi:carbamoyl-phosphate synthase large subunit
MVIAGGDWQIELIKKAKAMGHFVICSNLYEDSPAFPYADACEVSDVLDKERNLAIAKKYCPDAVISDQSDIAVPTVAYLNEQLGLRGIGMELADLFTNKALQRQFCRENGMNVPEFLLCRDAEEALPMLDKFGTVIIKPIDSQSSRGVFTIRSREELFSKVGETLSYSNREKSFLVEEYIDGAEFTIDGLMVNGHHYPLCISVKEMYPQNPNVSRMQSYSYHSSRYNYDDLRAANKKLYELAGLPIGLTHAEYKFHNGRFYLIEAGARGGGSNLSGKIVPFMSDIDNYDYLIREALGLPVDEDKLNRHVFSESKYVVMRFFDFGEGTVERVDGKEFLCSHPMLLDYQLNVKPGDVLKNPKYGRLRPGHFIIGGEGEDAVRAEAEKIISMVKVKFMQV